MRDPTLEQIFMYLIERTERQMNRYANAALKSNGIEISADQWVILKRIGDREEINQRELAELTVKDTASMTQMLDILEKDGLLKRVETENDRKSYNLVLTNAGFELVEKIAPIARNFRVQGLKGIQEDELLRLKKTLNKIYENYG